MFRLAIPDSESVRSYISLPPAVLLPSAQRRNALWILFILPLFAAGCRFVRQPAVFLPSQASPNQLLIAPRTSAKLPPPSESTVLLPFSTPRFRTRPSPSSAPAPVSFLRELMRENNRKRYLRLRLYRLPLPYRFPDNSVRFCLHTTRRRCRVSGSGGSPGILQARRP